MYMYSTLCDFFISSFSDVVFRKTVTIIMMFQLMISIGNASLLMTIVDYVFAPVTSMDVLDDVKDLIETHHSLFKEVYCTSPVIIKMHYMIHIPQWIER